MPSTTEYVVELLDLKHFITISATTPTKIIIAHTMAKVSKPSDRALVAFPLTTKTLDEQRSQFNKINNVPHQKLCLIIECCSEKTGNEILAVAMTPFLALAIIFSTYEQASSTTARIFAILKRISKTSCIIIFRHLPIEIQQCLQTDRLCCAPGCKCSSYTEIGYQY